MHAPRNKLEWGYAPNEMPRPMTFSSHSNLQGWRAGLLWFPDPLSPKVRHESDGLLVTGQSADGIVRVVAIGAWATLQSDYPDLPVTHWPGLCIAPGFVDLHIHYPQTDVIGSPADGLLPWLEHYTFPHEKQFSEPAYAHEVTSFFLDELMRHGVTTALCFATAHPESVDIFMAEAQRRRLRMITGKVLQDRNSPDGLRDTDTALSLRQTKDLIRRWHGVDRLGYAITPRFAPTSTAAQLHGAGEIAQQFPDVWIQSHVAENLDEIRWVHELFPDARSYLDVYDRAGLLRQRSVSLTAFIWTRPTATAWPRWAPQPPSAPPATYFWAAASLTTPLQTRPVCATAWPAMWAEAPASARFTPCTRPTPWPARVWKDRVCAAPAPA